VIDVEHRALGAFQQDRRASRDRPVHHEPDILGHRKQARRESLEDLDRLLDVGALG
jgi:hypothetical protein